MTAERADDAQILTTLMERYVDGDERAFEALYQAVQREVRKVLRRRLRSEDEVEDALQKTFLNVHAARHAYRRGSAVVPWIITIAKNVALDRLRRKSSRELQLHEEVAVQLVDPRDEVGEREALTALASALNALPADKRDVVVLHKIEGIPMSQVAREMGIKEGAARVRAHRGYRALRSALAA